MNSSLAETRTRSVCPRLFFGNGLQVFDRLKTCQGSPPLLALEAGFASPCPILTPVVTLTRNP